MCAWRKHETWVQLHTTETVQQKNVTLARDASPQKGNQYWAVRTLMCEDSTTFDCEILRNRRPPLQPQHERRCQTLGCLLRRGRDNSRENTFGVLNVVQIHQPSEEPRTTASCCTWFRSTGDNSSPKKALAILTEPPALPVTQSGRDNAAAATSAEAILPFETFLVGDTFQDRRQPGHQDAALEGSPIVHQPPRSSQRVPPGDPLDDSPLPNFPILDIVLTERDKQLLAELCRASAMALPRCIVSRHATAWAESLKGAISGHQSWAALCRYRCRLLLAEVPKTEARN